MKTIIIKILIGTAGSALVISGVYYGYNNFYKNNSDVKFETNTQKETSSNQESNTENFRKESDADKNSMASKISSGGNYKCTTSLTTKDIKSDNIIYISNKNMRVDGTTTYAGYKVKFYSLVKDGYVYGWGDSVAIGSKMKYDVMDVMKNNIASLDGASVNYSQNLAGMGINTNYKCADWSVDNSVFEIPTNIKFQEVANPMDGYKK